MPETLGTQAFRAFGFSGRIVTWVSVNDRSLSLLQQVDNLLRHILVTDGGVALDDDQAQPVLARHLGCDLAQLCIESAREVVAHRTEIVGDARAAGAKFGGADLA